MIEPRKKWHRCWWKCMQGPRCTKIMKPSTFIILKTCLATQKRLKKSCLIMHMRLVNAVQKSTQPILTKRIAYAERSRGVLNEPWMPRQIAQYVPFKNDENKNNIWKHRRNIDKWDHTNVDDVVTASHFVRMRIANIHFSHLKSPGSLVIAVCQHLLDILNDTQNTRMVRFVQHFFSVIVTQLGLHEQLFCV